MVYFYEGCIFAYVWFFRMRSRTSTSFSRRFLTPSIACPSSERASSSACEFVNSKDRAATQHCALKPRVCLLFHCWLCCFEHVNLSGPRSRIGNGIELFNVILAPLFDFVDQVFEFAMCEFVGARVRQFQGQRCYAALCV